VAQLVEERPRREVVPERDADQGSTFGIQPSTHRAGPVTRIRGAAGPPRSPPNTRVACGFAVTFRPVHDPGPVVMNTSSPHQT